MLGTRILRTAIIVGLALAVVVILHTGVLYPRGRCFASVHVDREHFSEESFYGEHNTKAVNLCVLSCCFGASDWLMRIRELFVMSKCPDAADAEATIATVMDNVGHKVNLNFTYIAS